MSTTESYRGATLQGMDKVDKDRIDVDVMDNEAKCISVWRSPSIEVKSDHAGWWCMSRNQLHGTSNL